jgi:hypothetical protein
LEPPIQTGQTNEKGVYSFPSANSGSYTVKCVAFGHSKSIEITINDDGDQIESGLIDLPLGLAISTPHVYDSDKLMPALRTAVGRHFVMRLEHATHTKVDAVVWNHHGISRGKFEAEFMATRMGPMVITATAEAASPQPQSSEAGQPAPRSRRVQAASSQDPQSDQPAALTTADVSTDLMMGAADTQMVGGNIGVTMNRTASYPTLDQALWVAIRSRTHAISFNRYREAMDSVLQWEEGQTLPELLHRRMRDAAGVNLQAVGAYQILKFATEAFLLSECGVRIGGAGRERFEPAEDLERLGAPFSRQDMERKLEEYMGNPPQLPYIKRIVDTVFPGLERDGGYRLMVEGIGEPCLIELIHTYWLEEGMLMQTMNAISYRFQNARAGTDRDALANMEIDSLRRLNNLLWGYVQDEINRLSVRRRAAEYAHEYGLALFGKSTMGLRPADNRSKFLEGFHNLLLQSSKFFKEDFQTTVIADGFPLLNALKEVHLSLAQGAGNQFRNLTWAARVETLMAQFMLARPEMREFLQSRIMVPYKEPWMPQVDTMKSLQGWTDVTVTHFRDLAAYGEQLLLSVRYGDWINVNDEDSAKNWARYWRPEIQGYLHAYRAATGVELTNTENVDATIPAVHLQRRMTMQQQQRAR